MIHGNADTAYTASGIDLPDFSVTGILYSVDFFPPQQLDQQIVKKVRSRADEDMIGVYAHGTERVKMVSDGLPQGGNALVGQGQQ